MIPIDLNWLFGSMSHFYLANGILSFLIAVIATFFLKKKFNDSYLNITFFVFMFNIALPGVGWLLSIWVVYYLLHVKYRVALGNVDQIDMSAFETEFPQVKRIFGEAWAEKLLQNDEFDASLKMKAIVSLADNITKQNIKLIKDNMSNKNDEIRLYSFAIIDGMERGINGKIHTILQNLQETTDKKESIELSEELSFLYWDLVYYELSDEVLQKFILEEVKRYANIVLDSKPDDPMINILLGKVYLKEADYDNAEIYFNKVVHRSEERDFIIPYLAEIYFNRREFDTLKSLGGIFKNVDSFNIHTKLYPVMQQWRNP